MEDEMAIANVEQLAFTAGPTNLISTNGQVKLIVGIPDDELKALQAAGGKIEISVLTPDGAPRPTVDADPRVAIWPPAPTKAPSKISLGVYVFRAEVWDGRKVRCGTTRVYVLRSAGSKSLLQVHADQTSVPAGQPVKLSAGLDDDDQTLRDAGLRIDWINEGSGTIIPDPVSPLTAVWDTTNARPGINTLTAHLVDEDSNLLTGPYGAMVGSIREQVRPRPLASGDIVRVALQRPPAIPTDDAGLWPAIRTHANAVSFGGIGVKGMGRTLRGYQGFIEQVLCEGNYQLADRGVDHCGPAPDLQRLARDARQLPIHGMAAYELLKTATEIFLLWNCGVMVRERDALGNPITSDNEELARSGMNIAQVTTSLENYLGKGRLPYIERVVQTAFPDYVSLDPASRGVFGNSVFCTGVLTPRADCVCLIELIWSYWHEEAMLVQSMNAITRRFQNVRSLGDRDPLAHVTIDPLRPLNNLLWGYVQDEPNRLSVKRRAAEYDHEYGITLRGKALSNMRPADSRSKFLEGFHNLLHKASIFYKEDNDTTVIADGFPLLNALKEVHLLLAQGAHNQFGDLPWAARVEMLIQQWLLARPEIRDFLQSRPMVPYTEAWMPQVDTMKTLQGWSDVTVTHFHDLAAFGEQIVLSIRYGDWIGLNDENHAKNWARYWRPEVTSYIHAYRTVTGIDLTNPDTVDSTMPAVHLQRRLAMQRAR
jgi:hypothetical protein